MTTSYDASASGIDFQLARATAAFGTASRGHTFRIIASEKSSASRRVPCGQRIVAISGVTPRRRAPGASEAVV